MGNEYIVPGMGIGPGMIQGVVQSPALAALQGATHDQLGDGRQVA